MYELRDDRWSKSFISRLNQISITIVTVWQIDLKTIWRWTDFPSLAQVDLSNCPYPKCPYGFKFNADIERCSIEGLGVNETDTFMFQPVYNNLAECLTGDPNSQSSKFSNYLIDMII